MKYLGFIFIMTAALALGACGKKNSGGAAPVPGTGIVTPYPMPPYPYPPGNPQMMGGRYFGQLSVMGDSGRRAFKQLLRSTGVCEPYSGWTISWHVGASDCDQYTTGGTVTLDLHGFNGQTGMGSLSVISAQPRSWWAGNGQIGQSQSVRVTNDGQTTYFSTGGSPYGYGYGGYGLTATATALGLNQASFTINISYGGAPIGTAVMTRYQ